MDPQEDIPEPMQKRLYIFNLHCAFIFLQAFNVSLINSKLTKVHSPTSFAHKKKGGEVDLLYMVIFV
jgi:hypothetical protein